MSKIKNIKISPESHETLKLYCKKHGFTLYKFIEKLIEEKCKEEKDIYGE
jgi:predicted HicB family RNase H-like nuclease|tara:strand:+ start:93 stop:242 length:150 start_codon:yes stop_codon:yes gene_type:complete